MSDSIADSIAYLVADSIATLKDELRAEIAGQLNEMKSELLRTLREEISRELLHEARVEAEATSSRIAADLNNKIVIANQNQISAANEKTRELVMGLGQQICDVMYDKVIGEINEHIVPKINNIMQFANYNMQDGRDLVDTYRQDVGMPRADNLLMGAKTSQISDHVSIFLDEDY